MEDAPPPYPGLKPQLQSEQLGSVSALYSASS